MGLDITRCADPAGAAFEDPSPDARRTGTREEDRPAGGEDALQLAGNHGAVPRRGQRGKMHIAAGKVSGELGMRHVIVQFRRTRSSGCRDLGDLRQASAATEEGEARPGATQLARGGQDVREAVPEPHVARVEEHRFVRTPASGGAQGRGVGRVGRAVRGAPQRHPVRRRLRPCQGGQPFRHVRAQRQHGAGPRPAESPARRRLQQGMHRAILPQHAVRRHHIGIEIHDPVRVPRPVPCGRRPGRQREKRRRCQGHDHVRPRAQPQQARQHPCRITRVIDQLPCRRAPPQRQRPDTPDPHVS